MDPFATPSDMPKWHKCDECGEGIDPDAHDDIDLYHPEFDTPLGFHLHEWCVDEFRAYMNEPHPSLSAAQRSPSVARSR